MEVANYLLLPRREGEPPKTQKSIPHSQLDCLPPQTTVQTLLNSLRRYFAPFVLFQQSCISVENAIGLVLCESETTGTERAFMRVTGSREFLHVHPDGSLHVNVPPKVEEEIIAKGWGEQHPKYSLGITEIMVYAPRDDAEIDVICQICYESFWYARGDTRMTLHNNALSGRQFGEEAEQALVAVLKRGKISRYTDWEGEVVNFERKAANYLGVNFALMVSSGTLALTCALLGVGLEPGDEVLVSAHTWISTAAAVVAIGCIPVIVDIDDSLGMSPLDAKKRISPLTRAMIVTHMRGIPCNLNSLLALARECNLKLIEDCAQCIGGFYLGRPVGTHGDAGVWSMNHFKNLCCGEGGLVFTNDRNVYERCWSASEPGFQEPTKLNSMKNFPQIRAFYSNWNTPHFVFTTGRASELMGALADIQLSQLPHNMDVLQSLRASFIANLKQPKGYTILQELKEAVSCATSLIVFIHTVEEVEDYLLHLRAEQVLVKPLFSKNQVDCSVYYHWTSILNKQSPFRSGFPWCKSNYSGKVAYSQDMCPQTLELLSRAISFEFSTRMTLGEAEFMALALNKADYRVHQLRQTF